MKTQNQIVYASQDYGKFVQDPTNRQPVANANLRASMEEYGWLPAYPAFVVLDGGKYKIKDGQNRFQVAHELNLPVRFVVSTEDAISIPEINNAQRRWSLKDYVSSYASQGKKDYVRLQALCSEFQLPLASSAALLYGVSEHATILPLIKTGRFSIRFEDRARDIVRVISLAKNRVPWAGHNRFVAAVAQVIVYGKADPAILYKQVSGMAGKKLTLCATVDQFVASLEVIYNHNRRDDSPYMPLAGNVKTEIKAKQRESGRRLGTNQAEQRARQRNDDKHN